MSEQTSQPESQKDRWLKYGANVLISCIVVIALAVVLVVISSKQKKRVDTTALGMYSLKPQTVNIIKDLKSPIKLVSLYSKRSGGTTEERRKDAEEHTIRMGVVADLLEEYKQKGKNIDVEIIDPNTEGSKVDALVNTAVQKYGGELQQHKDVVAGYDDVYKEIDRLAKEEAAKIAKLSTAEIQPDPSVELVPAALGTPASIPQDLKESRTLISRRLSLKPPDYRGATRSITDTVEGVSQQAAKIQEIFSAAKDNPKVPEPVRQYMATAGPALEKLKKTADDLLAKTKNLGSTEKLDEVRKKLGERDAILVLGENDMRSLSFNQAWTIDNNRATYKDEARAKPKFAGEQQITSAILSLTMEKKPKVVFIRPGGAPLTSPGFPPFQPSGPLSQIGLRLQDYNFQVLEKDLSGQWAQRAQMQGMPTPPEPTDEEIKDAIWVVLCVPSNPQQQQPPPSIGPKLKEHLKAGGSALCLFLPQADPMPDVLGEYGVQVRTDLVAVHEPVRTAARTADMVEEAQKVPFIFVTNKYGDHMITQPLSSLDAVLIPMLPVQTHPRDGITVTPILPVPSTTGKIWAEHEQEAAMGMQPIEFNADKGDLPGPLFGGAVSEKKGEGRVVAIGSLQFATNQLVSLPDMELAQRGIFVSRFPGNSELLLNSIFWLGRMEPMLAISPAAMEVSRIRDISEGALRFWRVGVLLIGLPALVIVAGALVYVKRRD